MAILGQPTYGILSKVPSKAISGRTQKAMALGKALNKCVGLNFGDLADPRILNPDLRKKDIPNVRKNNGNMVGMMWESWREVGAGGAARKGDISASTRGLGISNGQNKII